MHSDKSHAWKHQQKSVSMVFTWNSTSLTVKNWDKYHSCDIGNTKFHSALPFPIQHSWYLSQISLLPMLLHLHINYTHMYYCNVKLNRRLKECNQVNPASINK